MRYVMLGKTGIEVSEVGFGCIPIIRPSGFLPVLLYDRPPGPSRRAIG